MPKNWIGLLAAIVGLALGAIGGVALLVRPSPVANPESSLETSLAVIPPEALSQPNLVSVTVTATGMVDLRTARPVDAYAWAQGGQLTVVRGLDTWDHLAVERVWTAGGEAPEFPGDVWRSWDYGFQTETILAAEIEPGTALVVISATDAPLSTVSFEVTRDRGNSWAWPVIALGLLALAFGLVWTGLDAVRSPSPVAEQQSAPSPALKKGARP